MALTEAQKRANVADALRRKSIGDVKMTIWLSAGAKVRLDELTARHGTRQKALEAALMGSATVAPPAPVKAVQRAEKPVVKPSKVFGHPKPGKR